MCSYGYVEFYRIEVFICQDDYKSDGWSIYNIKLGYTTFKIGKPKSFVTTLADSKNARFA